MESKIDYHVLTMDEIVFDNRNKAYGAFKVRSIYEKNLLKAILLSAGLFALGMSSPAILKNLGVFAEAQNDVAKKIIYILDDFPGTVLPPAPVTVPKPAGHSPTTDYIVPIEKSKLPAVTPDPPQTIPSTPATPSGPVVNGPSGGTPAGGGEDFRESNPVNPSDIYRGPVEVMPEYPGGDEAFGTFVNENLPYPEQLRADDVEGITRIEFVVNTDGSIEQVKVSQSSGYADFDAAALKLVKSIRKYKPGKQNGHAVRVLCVLPIGFEIN